MAQGVIVDIISDRKSTESDMLISKSNDLKLLLFVEMMAINGNLDLLQILQLGFGVTKLVNKLLWEINIIKERL